jgi:hypothetical protein
MVSGGGRSRQKEARGAGLSSSGEEKEGLGTSLSSREGSRRSRAREGRGTVGRRSTTSPWRFGSQPRRAHKGQRRVARSRGFRDEPGVHEVNWAGARRVAGDEWRRHGVTVKTEREERERWSEGKLVNNSKFQSAVCKFSFSPSTWPQMKNF